jgi:hypothetical protein
VYLVFGPRTDNETLDHRWDDTEAGITPSGRFDSLGAGVAAIPDMEGDGLDDLVVTSLGDTCNICLFYGENLGGTLPDTDVDHGFTGGFTGVASGGDLDGDGLGDLLVTSYVADSNGDASGSVYAILGPASNDGEVETAAMAELTGRRGDRLGRSVSATDLDADGFADILVGAPDYGGGGCGGCMPGAVFLAMGPFSGKASLIDVARARLDGTTGDYSTIGYAVSFVGDRSGDGSPEILVGDIMGKSLGGTTYLIEGDKFL